MSTTPVSFVPVVADCPVHDCPECRASLWFSFCERCGGHYECDGCGHVFILKPDGWYRLNVVTDALLRVGE